jgi:hypothetical protein
VIYTAACARHARASSPSQDERTATAPEPSRCEPLSFYRPTAVPPYRTALFQEHTMLMQHLQVITYNALRIVAGIAFMTHGGQKLFGFFSDRPAMAPLLHLGEFLAHFWPFGMAGILEFFGGLLMVLGRFGR